MAFDLRQKNTFMGSCQWISNKSPGYRKNRQDNNQREFLPTADFQKSPIRWKIVAFGNYLKCQSFHSEWRYGFVNFWSPQTFRLDEYVFFYKPLFKRVQKKPTKYQLNTNVTLNKLQWGCPLGCSFKPCIHQRSLLKERHESAFSTNLAYALATLLPLSVAIRKYDTSAARFKFWTRSCY